MVVTIIIAIGHLLASNIKSSKIVRNPGTAGQLPNGVMAKVAGSFSRDITPTALKGHGLRQARRKRRITKAFMELSREEFLTL